MEIDLTDGDEAPEPADVVPFAEGDLGTIQGILFGAQAEHLEREMAALEERLVGRLDATGVELRNEIERSERRLRSRVDKAVAKLGDDSVAEREARVAAIAGLEASQAEHKKVLEESIEVLRTQLDEMDLTRHEFADILEHAAQRMRPSGDAMADNG